MIFIQYFGTFLKYRENSNLVHRLVRTHHKIYCVLSLVKTHLLEGVFLLT